MRARILAPPLFALAFGLLAACGDGLYDAGGVPLLQTGGATCDAGQIVCGGTCTVEDATHCLVGDGCVDCTAGTPPAGGRAACLREGAAATCGFECTGGLLRCGDACCGATALAAGDRHTCALLEGGQVSCWGANEAGQVGDGSTGARPAPAAVPLGAAAVAVSAGAAHTCAVTAAGAVRCWGANDAGQATGTPTAGPVLAPAATPVGSGAVSVAAGAGHTCARLGSGAVRCWGRNGLQQLGPGGQPIAAGAGTTALAAGRDHTCAVVAGGAVRCWGSNASGQLGATPSAGIATPIGSGIQLLAAGGDQTCAATGTSTGTWPDDALQCWGASLGGGWLMEEPALTPQIPRRDVDRATVDWEVGLLAAGPRFACARKKTEQVDCLGLNDAGQLGGVLLTSGQTVTVPLVSAAPVATALAAGGAHACAALAEGGAIRCWGANASGQLGDGTLADPGVGVLATPLGR